MTRKSLALVFIAALVSPLPAAAQMDELRLPVIIDAERTDYDGNTSMLQFTGLKLTQGNISIEADVAHATRMDFDSSVWRFSGNVVFDVEEGRITADTADLEFSNFRLLEADISGDPATFRFRRAENAEPTYAEAGRLVYNVPDGIVEFSGGATIVEDGNRITSDSLVYNVREQRINAASGAGGQDRVKLTYTPPAADSDAEESAEPDSESGADEDAGGTGAEGEPGADEPRDVPEPGAGGEEDARE